MENYAELMFHDAVQALQDKAGTRERYQTFYPHRTDPELTEDDIAFLTSRESFYMATVTPDGWPYVQHRGGAAGFVRIVGPNRIACADYVGNKQFISMGNLACDARVSLFFMDYGLKARLKLQGRACLTPWAEAEPALQEAVAGPGPQAERILTVDVVARDWNCPKYIPNLYSEAALRDVVGPQIAQLQAENARLKAQLAALQDSL